MEASITKLIEQQREIESLRAKVAELEADAKRLDWLAKNSYIELQCNSPKNVVVNLRSAIDAAMRSEG